MEKNGNVLTKAIQLAMEQFRNEYGEDAMLEEGDQFATVFNDGVMVIGIEENQLKIGIHAGSPYLVDYDIGLLEK